MNAGDVLKLRKDLGESQSAFGARFGVNQSTVNRWEKNGLPPRGTARHAVEMLKEELQGALQ